MRGIKVKKGQKGIKEGRRYRVKGWRTMKDRRKREIKGKAARGD